MDPEINYEAKDYRIPFAEQEKWKAYLKEYGFVVIANYIDNQEELQRYVDQIWNIMEILSEGKLKKNDESTHSEKKNYPPLLHGGMIQYIGHSQVQWNLRKRCKPIFQRLWNNPDVKSSFDGLCFMHGAQKFQKNPHNAFLHTDQSPMKNFVWSYQGIMTLTDAGENQGGYVCVPRTHLHHHKYFQDRGLMKHKRDWYKFPAEEKVKEPMCYDQKINTKAGDFILFDSRTFHCNTVPLTNSLRIVTYICMIPSKKVQPRILQGRKKAVEDKRTTSHHPGDGFRTFAQMPNQVEDPQRFRELQKQINVFEMDAEIESLI